MQHDEEDVNNDPLRANATSGTSKGDGLQGFFSIFKKKPQQPKKQTNLAINANTVTPSSSSLSARTHSADVASGNEHHAAISSRGSEASLNIGHRSAEKPGHKRSISLSENLVDMFGTPRKGGLDDNHGPLSQAPPPKIIKHTTFPDGSSYDGEWDTNNKFDGRGSYIYVNGDTYDGDFSKGMKHGYGTCVFESGKILTLQGYWENDLPSQKSSSVICYKNGDKYVGGLVVEKNISGGLPRVVKHGKGELHFKNGDKYYGGWRKDQMDGYGVMVQSNKRKYYGSWQEGSRHGQGVMLYEDGTTYEGDWQKGIRDGSGTLRLPNGDAIIGIWKDNQIKNATYEKKSVKAAARCSRLLLSEQLNNVQEIPGEVTLIGDKWQGFFVSHIDILETERHSFMESSVYNFIQSKNACSNNGGDLTPLTAASIRDNLESYLQTILSPDLGRPSLGTLVHEFGEIFAWRYTSHTDSPKILLPHAVDDILSFSNKLHKKVCAILGETMQLYGVRSLKFFLKNFVLKKVYKTLFSLYREIYREQDAIYTSKLKSLAQATMSEIGVMDAFIPSEVELFDPYDSAIEALKSMSMACTPSDKCDSLVATSVEIENTVKIIQMSKGIPYDKQRGAEDLFPIFLHVFIKAGIPSLYSEYQFLQNFIDEHVLSSEKAYRFSNFEAAMQYVRILDWNIRDERGVLVPTSLLEEKIEDAVSTALRRAQQSRQEGPRLLWITRLFIELGNNAKEIFKNNTYRLNEQYAEMAHNNFDTAKELLECAGLRLERYPGKNAELPNSTAVSGSLSPPPKELPQSVAVTQEAPGTEPSTVSAAEEPTNQQQQQQQREQPQEQQPQPKHKVVAALSDSKATRRRSESLISEDMKQMFKPVISVQTPRSSMLQNDDVFDPEIYEALKPADDATTTTTDSTVVTNDTAIVSNAGNGDENDVENVVIGPLETSSASTPTTGCSPLIDSPADSKLSLTIPSRDQTPVKPANGSITQQPKATSPTTDKRSHVSFSDTTTVQSIQSQDSDFDSDDDALPQFTSSTGKSLRTKGKEWRSKFIREEKTTEINFTFAVVFERAFPSYVYFRMASALEKAVGV